MTVPEGTAAALRDRRAVVATGVDEPLLRTIVEVLSDRVDAGEKTESDAAGEGRTDAAGESGSDVADATVGTPWRVALRPEAADRVADEFVLSTRVQGLREAGTLEVRIGATDDPAVLSAEDAAFAIAGPTAEPTLLSDAGPSSSVRAGARARFDAAAPFEDVGPSRETLRASARDDLSTAFAAELDAALEGAERLDRRADANVLTLSLAVGARTDHLFGDVRTWAEHAGIAAREQFIAPRDALVDRGLVETIKTPIGRGHPHSRLRVADEALAECAPVELVDVLAERFAGRSGHGGGGDASSDRTPVWRR